MRTFVITLWFAVLPATLFGQTHPTTPSWERLVPPTSIDGWVRPAASADAMPIWGFADGLRIGLAPLPGPRGLLRVYAPYLAQPMPIMINYIAVEPIVAGQPFRGLSELEHSTLDNTNGKRFESLDHPTDLPSSIPAAGTLITVDGQSALRVFISVESYDSGAHVYLQLTFRADRQHSVGIAAFTFPDSKPLAECIITATMGNYARLRRLQLADQSVTARSVWPGFNGDGFTAHATFPLTAMLRDADAATVEATTDEANPTAATYVPGTARHWQYSGRAARQSWRCDNPDPKLMVSVNGRTEYWASRKNIPNGIAFENFELIEPFRQGADYWYSVEPIGSGEVSSVTSQP